MPPNRTPTRGSNGVSLQCLPQRLNRPLYRRHEAVSPVIGWRWQGYLRHDDTHICGFFEEYRWLSNFHVCLVVYGGYDFPSSENAYQAAKDDPQHWAKFTTCSPSEAKKYGKMASVDKQWWDSAKEEVMLDCLQDKFTRNDDLRQKLLDTGDRYLEETNWWGDKFWASVAVWA